MSLVRANAPLQKPNFQHCQLDDLARYNHALKKEGFAFQQEIATKNKCAFTANEVAKVEHAKEHAIELAEWKPEYQEKHTRFGRHSRIASASLMSRIESLGKLAVFAI